MTGTLNPAHPSDRWFAVVVGARVRQLRRQHSLSPAQLAGKAGISLSTVSSIERQPRPSGRIRTLARLAAALNQPPGALTPSELSSHDDR